MTKRINLDSKIEYNNDITDKDMEIAKQFLTDIRTFESGATRDVDTEKFDLEGFLSYPVIMWYAEYMHKHRIQSDGQLRDSDNWQKGIPKDAYMKSMWRHFMDVWGNHRKYKTRDNMKEALCALLFNVLGYLHEETKQNYD
jgi:hypothetical protein